MLWWETVDGDPMVYGCQNDPTICNRLRNDAERGCFEAMPADFVETLRCVDAEVRESGRRIG